VPEIAGMSALGSMYTEHLIDLLISKQQELGIEDVYFGDQTSIPRVPAVCVEPASVSRTMIGVPMRTDNEIIISIVIYMADVQGIEYAQHKADLKSEEIIAVVNRDGAPEPSGGTRFGGICLYGFVRDSEYGYIVKDGKLLRANRLMVYATSRTNHLEA
jgi:hypothetical protein